MKDSLTCTQDPKPGGKELPPGTRLEEFVIERVLGSGGFGITYLAKDVSLSRQVVIKENLPSQFAHRDTTSLTVHAGPGREDQENFRWSLENFSREGETLASLRHPGIVPVLRRFEAFGTAYFVMPYIEGATLDVLLRERQEAIHPFTETELRGLLERVLDALGYLHDRGIYHRDIKPGNILMTADGLPVLIDFGSARQRLSERSMTVVESVGYTPFEQLQSRGNVGPWSDLYALAATLVKVMTGEAPPKAMDRMRDDPYLPLVTREELSGRFSPVFLSSLDRALKVDEKARWEDAAAWRDSLSGNARGPQAGDGVEVEPVNEASNSTTGHVARSSLAVAALGAFLILVIVSWMMTKEQRGAEIADAELAVTVAPTEKSPVPQPAETPVPVEEVSKGSEQEFDIAPDVRITMCWIPPGEFVMGSPEGEAGRIHDETQYRVKFSNGFWLAKTETTQEQWQAVMGSNPSHFKGDDLPVESVSWNEVAGPGGFIQRVNQVGATGEGQFSLPTEAQWEYACRAGGTGPFAGGPLDELGWYDGNSGSKTHKCSTKKANAWGLHDMHGNVWEWCLDWYGVNPLGGKGVAVDPVGASSGTYRLLRGGSWINLETSCRAAYRSISVPGGLGNSIGFRLARNSVP